MNLTSTARGFAATVAALAFGGASTSAGAEVQQDPASGNSSEKWLP